MRINLSLSLLCALAICFWFPPHSIIASTTVPEVEQPWDPDMINLQLREAPLDAQALLLGDSITERWRFRKESLEEAVGPRIYANLGVGGSTSHDLLLLVRSGKLDRFTPRVFIVMIGTNDLPTDQPGTPETAARIKGNIHEIITELQRRWSTAAIVLLGIPPGPYPERAAFVAKINRDLAAIKRVHFVDVGDRLKRADYAEDGLHLSDSAYKILSSELRIPLSQQR